LHRHAVLFILCTLVKYSELSKGEIDIDNLIIRECYYGDIEHVIDL